MKEKVYDAFVTSCVNDDEDCPYHSRCRRRKKEVVVSYADIYNPKDMVNFALWNLTPKSKVWIKKTDGINRFFSCDYDNSPCYYERMEKQITDELRKKVSEKVRDASHSLKEIVESLKYEYRY